jgi:hypothetical protein
LLDGPEGSLSLIDKQESEFVMKWPHLNGRFIVFVSVVAILLIVLMPPPWQGGSNPFQPEPSGELVSWDAATATGWVVRSNGDVLSVRVAGAVVGGVPAIGCQVKLRGTYVQATEFVAAVLLVRRCPASGVQTTD